MRQVNVQNAQNNIAPTTMSLFAIVPIILQYADPKHGFLNSTPAYMQKAQQKDA